MSKTDLKAIVWQEGNWYVAKAIGVEIASQGETREIALENLQEAVDLLFEDEQVKMPSYFMPENPEITAIYA